MGSMPFHESVAGHLRATAENAPQPLADDLEAAAAKLDGFFRAPGTRKEADRIVAVLTPEVLTAIGEAFVTMRSDEIAHPEEHFGSEYVTTGYALAALINGAAIPELAAAADVQLAKVLALIPSMTPQQVDQIELLSSKYRKEEAAVALRAAVSERLAREPETQAEQWDKELGLGMPAGTWEMYIRVPVVMDQGRLDAAIVIEIESYPGMGAGFSLRMGAANYNALGGGIQVIPQLGLALGEYERFFPNSQRSLKGSVSLAEVINDIPGVLAQVEAAHPELHYDREAIEFTGSPGRINTPTRKKKIISWLSGT